MVEVVCRSSQESSHLQVTLAMMWWPPGGDRPSLVFLGREEKADHLLTHLLHPLLPRPPPLPPPLLIPQTTGGEEEAPLALQPWKIRTSKARLQSPENESPRVTTSMTPKLTPRDPTESMNIPTRPLLITLHALHLLPPIPKRRGWRKRGRLHNVAILLPLPPLLRATFTILTWVVMFFPPRPLAVMITELIHLPLPPLSPLLLHHHHPLLHQLLAHLTLTLTATLLPQPLPPPPRS